MHAGENLSARKPTLINYFHFEVTGEPTGYCQTLSVSRRHRVNTLVVKYRLTQPCFV